MFIADCGLGFDGHSLACPGAVQIFVNHIDEYGADQFRLGDGGSMKKCVMLFGAVALSGCASTPMPNSFNGYYYMAGDKGCKRIHAVTPTRVLCYDKKGIPTGYRDAMNDQQLQMWRFQSAQHDAEMAELNQSIRDLGNAAQGWGQQFQQQAQSFSAPQVQSISPNGYSNGIRYTQVGNALMGSNGVTYRWIGNTFVGTDGSKCRAVGQVLMCR